MSRPLTLRQLQRIRRLPSDYRIVAAQKGSPVVRCPDGQRLLVQPNGRLAAYDRVERVQSYLHLERG